MDSTGGPRGTPHVSHSGHLVELEGHLLERVCRAHREAAELGDPRHTPFLVAAGALAVYARACRVPMDALLRELERALATTRPRRGAALQPQLWEQARHAVTTNYYQAD